LAAFDIRGRNLQDFSITAANAPSSASPWGGPYPVVETTYTPNGAGYIGPVAQAQSLGQNMDFGTVSAVVSAADDWGGNVTAPPAMDIDLGSKDLAASQSVAGIVDCGFIGTLTH
jgi:hypothetical protein